MSTGNDSGHDSGIAQNNDDSDSYTVNHLSEADAEAAVDAFEARVDRIEAGEANEVTASGTVFLEDEIHDIVSDGPTVYLVDGEPLAEWLDGRVEETRVDADAE